MKRTVKRKSSTVQKARVAHFKFSKTRHAKTFVADNGAIIPPTGKIKRRETYGR